MLWCLESLTKIFPETSVESQQKIIVYDNSHTSPFSFEHEQEILHHIRAAMKRQNVTEELVLFSKSQRTDMTRIRSTFQSARTIIGPYNRHEGGNFIWTHPSPSNCGERTQFLEFIPGKDYYGAPTMSDQNHPYASQVGSFFVFVDSLLGLKLTRFGLLYISHITLENGHWIFIIAFCMHHHPPHPRTALTCRISMMH